MMHRRGWVYRGSGRYITASSYMLAYSRNCVVPVHVNGTDHPLYRSSVFPPFSPPRFPLCVFPARVSPPYHFSPLGKVSPPRFSPSFFPTALREPRRHTGAQQTPYSLAVSWVLRRRQQRDIRKALRARRGARYK